MVLEVHDKYIFALFYWQMNPGYRKLYINYKLESKIYSFINID